MPIQSVLQASQDSKIHATSPQPSHLVTIYRVFVILPMLGEVQYLCGPYSLCFLRMTFWSLSWNKTVSPALGALCSSKLKRRQRMLNVSPLWTAWNLRILEWPSDSTNHRDGAVQKFVFKKPSIQEWSAMLAGIFGTHFRHGTENIYKKAPRWSEIYRYQCSHGAWNASFTSNAFCHHKSFQLLSPR